MRGTTHLVGGALAALLAQKIGLLEPGLLPIAAAALGSLLPDIDHPHSLIGKRMRPVSDIISLVVGHRGITHSLVAIALMSAWIAYMGASGSLVTAIAIGYLSHLLLDAMTPAGLPLLWPQRRVFRIRTGITTGGVMEMGFMAGMAVAAVAVGL